MILLIYISNTYFELMSFHSNCLFFLLLLLVGAHAEVARHAGHGSTQALGVMPCMRLSCQSQLPAVTIDSLQPVHGRPPSGERVQAQLISLDTTLLTGSDQRNLET